MSILDQVAALSELPETDIPMKLDSQSSSASSPKDMIDDDASRKYRFCSSQISSTFVLPDLLLLGSFFAFSHLFPLCPNNIVVGQPKYSK